MSKKPKNVTYGVFNEQGWYTGHNYKTREPAEEKASRSTGCWVDKIYEDEDVTQRRQPRTSDAQ